MYFYEEFTVDEAATRLGVSKPVVYSLIKRGEIKAYDIGYGRTKPRWRIEETELRRYMDRAYPLSAGN